MEDDGAVMAHAKSDGEDRLVSAEEPIAGLQFRCGGELPGTIAIPELLEVVSKARRYELKLARLIHAHDGVQSIMAWIEVEPRLDGESGCMITMLNWRATPLPPEDQADADRRATEIDRHVAELVAQLDAEQRLLAVDFDAPDLAQLGEAMQAGIGRQWTDFISVDMSSHRQSLHWRLLDGARLSVPGSDRIWQVSLVPHQTPRAEPTGYELLLTAREPLARQVEQDDRSGSYTSSLTSEQRLVGREVAPVLRQPISRIIANAETIRSRLAGPLGEEYARYAVDIATAGEHLLGLLDDFSDLEVIEADDFTTATDEIDLAGVVRQAAGILGVRAHEKDITIVPSRDEANLLAIAEFRRALQILLNLLGNAIRYSPRASRIWILLERKGKMARAIIADQGPGLSDDDQQKIFDKFERLGRSGDGGSGLGLYISRRLARAMGGDLRVESAPGEGARFILDLPAAIE